MPASETDPLVELGRRRVGALQEYIRLADAWRQAWGPPTTAHHDTLPVVDACIKLVKPHLKYFGGVL